MIKETVNYVDGAEALLDNGIVALPVDSRTKQPNGAKAWPFYGQWVRWIRVNGESEIVVCNRTHPKAFNQIEAAVNNPKFKDRTIAMLMGFNACNTVTGAHIPNLIHVDYDLSKGNQFKMDLLKSIRSEFPLLWNECMCFRGHHRRFSFVGRSDGRPLNHLTASGYYEDESQLEFRRDRRYCIITGRHGSGSNYRFINGITPFNTHANQLGLIDLNLIQQLMDHFHSFMESIGNHKRIVRKQVQKGSPPPLSTHSPLVNSIAEHLKETPEIQAIKPTESFNSNLFTKFEWINRHGRQFSTSPYRMLEIAREFPLEYFGTMDHWETLTLACHDLAQCNSKHTDLIMETWDRISFDNPRYNAKANMKYWNGIKGTGWSRCTWSSILWLMNPANSHTVRLKSDHLAIRTFLMHHCKAGSQNPTPTDAYNQFKQWCETHSPNYTPTDRAFSRGMTLHCHRFGITMERCKINRKNAYKGIELK